MKITLAESAGFCVGVKRAIAIALSLAKKHKNIEMLGDLVHNEEVVRFLEESGIKKIKRLTKGKDKILLIRAHGESKKIYQKAQRLNYRIIDATCKMVKGIHNIASSMEKKGYQIVIIGDKSHDEVKGIMGQLKNKAIVINDCKSIPCQGLRKFKKIAIVVQSTQNEKKVNEIVEKIKPCVTKMRFFNTICLPTRLKQSEIQTMPLKHQVMVIIGSKKSANTKRLFEISKSLNKNSYWIHTAKDLKKIWFRNVKSVGVTAGASTPEFTIKEVIRRIRALSKKF